LYAACIEYCVLRLKAANLATTRNLGWMFLVGLALPALFALLWLGGSAIQPGAFGSRDFNVWQRLLTEGRVLLDYLHWLVLPDLSRMSLYHDDYVISRGWLSPASTLFSMLALVLLLITAVALRQRRPLFTLGVLWFFAAQALTATVIPLEIMFEHRNYFASLGICLALADLLVLAPKPGGRTRAAGLLAVLLVCFFATTTWMRAKEWSDPLRFASTEAAKHPQSPRATYGLARLLCNLTGYKPGPGVPEAMAALEHARSVKGSTVQAEQALLIFASRTGIPLKEEWWRDAVLKLRSQPIDWQVTGAIAAMVKCSELKLCNFPRERMLAVFAAALSHGDNAEVYNLYGSYALNGLRDVDLCLRLWREAIRLMPGEPQYRINLTRLFIALRADEEARVQIAALRALGTLGQHEKAARELERSMSDRKPALPGH
jgi:hypothetical protein